MYIDDRTTREYLDGVEEFCIIATRHIQSTNVKTIFCPCRDCKNVLRYADIKKIENHLVIRGFMPDYNIWYWHGEKLPVDRSSQEDVLEEDTWPLTFENSDSDESVEEDRISEMMDGLGDHVHEGSRMDENVSKAAETPLYPGCTKYSKLSGMLDLFNLKTLGG